MIKVVFADGEAQYQIQDLQLLISGFINEQLTEDKEIYLPELEQKVFHEIFLLIQELSELEYEISETKYSKDTYNENLSLKTFWFSAYEKLKVYDSQLNYLRCCDRFIYYLIADLIEGTKNVMKLNNAGKTIEYIENHALMKFFN